MESRSAATTSSNDEILQRVYDLFRASGDWPAVRDLQREYKSRGDFRTIAARIGRDSIICQEGPTGKCYLTLSALAVREHAHDDLEHFFAAVRLAAQSYSERGPEPVTHVTFARELNIHGAVLARLGRVLLLENFIFSGGASSTADMSAFSLTPGERAIHFDDVHTFADYQVVVRRVTAEERERGLLQAAEIRGIFEDVSAVPDDETFRPGDQFHSRQRLYHVLATATTDEVASI